MKLCKILMFHFIPSYKLHTTYTVPFTRLVRFNRFLSQVPYKQSLGFGGNAGPEPEVTGDGYDKGLVQKMVLIILKCVALTTREAR